MDFLRKRPALNLLVAFCATVNAAFWMLLSLAALSSVHNERIMEEMERSTLCPLLLGSSALTALAFYLLTWCSFRTFCGVTLLTASLQLLLESV